MDLCREMQLHGQFHLLSSSVPKSQISAQCVARRAPTRDLETQRAPAHHSFEPQPLEQAPFILYS